MFSSYRNHRVFTAIIGLFLFVASCSSGQITSQSTDISDKKEVATVAGGCFWCIEAPFEEIDGIYSVVSGYSGGKEVNPTYGDVSSGKTGHTESVQITFNPEVVSYTEILDVFWQQFDPTDAGGSFYDRGNQYKSIIFTHTQKQKEVTLKSKKELNSSGIFKKAIVTEIIDFETFYPAEEYHQDYYDKSTLDYKVYRKGSGRDKFIQNHWEVLSSKKYPKKSASELKTTLTPLQYKITMEDGTEPAYNNEYNNNKETGIYVCIVSGAPLFSSKDKYDSKTGWPSFTKPIDARALTKPLDNSLGTSRIEVRSKFGDSHLGHIFYDGPEPTKLRYCINSAALKFVAKKDMAQSGYQNYLWLVE